MAVGTPSRRVRRFTALLLAATLLATVTLVAASPAGASPTVDHSTTARAASTGEYYSLINSLRTSKGLPALQVDSALAASSQRWTEQMASTMTLSHDPNLASAVSGWTKIGENVGTGPTTTSIWEAFLGSPPHLTNLLEPSYTHVGVGILVDSRGAQWTAHRFARYPTPSPTTTAPSAPAPTPAPAPTAPPASVVTTPANPGDSVDCVNFSTWENANHWYLYYRPYYGDVAHLDDDGDGVVCEWLAGSPQRVVQGPTTPAPTTSPVTAAPTTTAPTTAAPARSGNDQGSGLGEAPATGAGSVAGTASADPDRVSPLIDALRLLG